MPERWLDVAWNLDCEADDALVGRIHVVLANEPGSLGTLTTVIGRDGGNISNLKITNRSPAFFEMLIDIQVTDVKHLTNFLAAFRSTSVLNPVDWKSVV